jgi:cell wall-associated NlpC family hydrolase
MVGRLSIASLLLVAVAALAASRPAIAEPEIVFDPLDPSAALSPSVPASSATLTTSLPTVPPTAPTTDAPTAFQEGAAEIAAPLDSSSSYDSNRTQPGRTESSRFEPTSPADEILDPTEAAAAPRAAATAPSPGAAPAVSHDPSRDSGELGIEYQLSVHDAESFLDRLSTRFKSLVGQAMTYLGTPYRMGGTSRRGLDCSGLVGAVYGEQGMDLPRTAAEQFHEGAPVAESDLRPGDLVFFHDTYKRGISHVGIYIGDGRFLHAAGRRHGVIVSELSRPYYHLRFAGARRPAAEPGAAEALGGQSESDAATPVSRAAAASTLAAAPR